MGGDRAIPILGRILFWTILVGAVLLVVIFTASGQYLLALSLAIPLLLFAYLMGDAALLQ